MSKKKTLKLDVPFVVIFALLILLYSFWWAAQSWQACGKLHSNVVAQYICLQNN